MSRRSRAVLACTLALWIALPVAPLAAQETTPPAEPTAFGEVKGKVQSVDEKPIDGAVLHFYHLGTRKTVSSSPTDPRGRFELTGLEHGYYDLAVETDDGLFVVGQVVNVNPSGKSALVLTLVPDRTPAAASERRSFLGRDTLGAGRASMETRPRGIDYWKSTKGLVILAGAGSVLLFGIALSSDDDDELFASPSTP